MAKNFLAKFFEKVLGKKTEEKEENIKPDEEELEKSRADVKEDTEGGIEGEK
jgi:hypothetical protein